MKKSKDFVSRVMSHQVLIIGHLHDEIDGKLVLSRAAVEKLEHYTSVLTDSEKTMKIWLETNVSIEKFKRKGYNVEKIPLKTFRSPKLSLAYERVYEKVNQIIADLEDLHLEKWTRKKEVRVMRYARNMLTKKEIRLIKLWIQKTMTSINDEIQQHINVPAPENHIKIFVVGNLHAMVFIGKYPTMLIDHARERDVFGRVLYAIEKM